MAGDLSVRRPLIRSRSSAGVIRQPAGELEARGIVDRHDVPFVKSPVDVDHADGQQAAALLLDRPAGAGVDGQPAAGLGGEADPALPRRQGLPLGEKQRADQLAGDDPARLPGCRPLAMITFSPAVVAIRAASILLAMPPLLRPVAWSRTRA